MSQHLSIQCAGISNAGIKNINEDAICSQIPTDTHLLEYKGVALALADGVSNAEAGKAASNIAVNTFVDEYFKTPDTWSVAHSAEQLLSTINLRLYNNSHSFSKDKGFLCTFIALILKSQTAHFIHVGDSRIYHFRAGILTQLTQDHKIQVNKTQSYLARALGMDNRLQVDIGKIPIQAGDRFLLTSDGIHDFISAEALHLALASNTPPQPLCEQLLQQALSNKSDDNISCMMCDIVQIAEESIDEYNERLTRLPFPPHLQTGMQLDDYLIVKELYSSSRSYLYLVRNIHSQALLVMKTPSPKYCDDSRYIDRFVREEWIGSRINSDAVVRIVRQTGERSCLYYLMEYIQGTPLNEWMLTHKALKPSRAISIIDNIALGLKAFHQSNAVHQDLTPQNIMVLENDQIKIVDFSSTFVGGIDEIFSPFERETALGNTSYSDPHYLLGRNTGIQGDVYALATITYELFTGKLPYGEAINNCHLAEDYDRLRYINAASSNPIIPLWFDRTLARGVAINTEERYHNIATLLHDLHNPNPEYLREEIKHTTNHNSLLFWKLLSGFWFVTLILVIYLFVGGK
jgi:serine/threonine protein phosphatase PrpC